MRKHRHAGKGKLRALVIPLYVLLTNKQEAAPAPGFHGARGKDDEGKVDRRQTHSAKQALPARVCDSRMSSGQALF